MWIGAVERARAYGIDISLLRSCLLRPPEERLRMACDNATGIARFRRRSADYAGLLDRLLACKASFILVGSMAAAAQGSAYVPDDMTICFDATLETADTLASVLQPIHPHARGADDGDEWHIDVSADFWEPPLALRTDEGDLNLLAHVEGIGDYNECLAVSESIPWGETRVRVLAIEGLIVALENRLTPDETGPLMALGALLYLCREGNQRLTPSIQCF
jgi:hypothetical protein